MFAYAAIAIGDVLVGFVSQWFIKQEENALPFLWHHCFFMILFFTAHGRKAVRVLDMFRYWFRNRLLGNFCNHGCRAIWYQYTCYAATTIPNMVRGMLAIFIIPLFKIAGILIIIPADDMQL